jgi:hypothetical protein
MTMARARATRISRRELLATAAGLAGAAALAPSALGAEGVLGGPPAARLGVPEPPARPAGANVAAQRTDGATEIIGRSSGGIPLTVFWIGAGPVTVVIQGAIHGGPEANTSALSFRLRDYFDARRSELPDGVRLALLPEANPDGIAVNSRFYLSSVDGNRNWDTPDWERDAYDGNGVLRRGLGGAAPMSEPETRATADWLLALRPAAVVQYHSRGGFVVGARELAEPYGRASGYHVPALRPPGATGGGGGLLPYRATGTMGRWLTLNDLPGILIELSDWTTPEFDRNLAGLRTVLRATAPS